MYSSARERGRLGLAWYLRRPVYVGFCRDGSLPTMDFSGYVLSPRPPQVDSGRPTQRRRLNDPAAAPNPVAADGGGGSAPEPVASAAPNGGAASQRGASTPAPDAGNSRRGSAFAFPPRRPPAAGNGSSPAPSSASGPSDAAEVPRGRGEAHFEPPPGGARARSPGSGLAVSARGRREDSSSWWVRWSVFTLAVVAHHVVGYIITILAFGFSFLNRVILRPVVAVRGIMEGWVDQIGEFITTLLTSWCWFMLFYFCYVCAGMHYAHGSFHGLWDYVWAWVHGDDVGNSTCMGPLEVCVVRVPTLGALLQSVGLSWGHLGEAFAAMCLVYLCVVSVEWLWTMASRHVDLVCPPRGAAAAGGASASPAAGGAPAQ